MNAITDELRLVLDGPWQQLRDQVRTDASGEWMLGEPGEPIQAQRERTHRQLLQIADRGYGRVGFPTEYGGTYDYGASCVLFEMQALGDLSTVVKTGVQFGLFGGAIARLGTRRHHEKYLEDVMTGRLLGCFAMTEEGHGSNVQQLETLATYDPDTDELVIDSPTPGATKTYIGGAARDAAMAVVFAQLSVGGQAHGVHAVIVPIRDESGRPRPGVTIGDNGEKAGLPGVDNGKLSFAGVRVPRANLLNAFGDITDTGTYTSSIESPNARFFTTLGTLVRGRVCVGAGAAAAARKALAIAARYGETRRQFSAPGNDREIVILDYLAHQRNLLPHLAKAYALALAQNDLTGRLQQLQGAPRPDHPSDEQQLAQREFETRVAGMKAVSSWHALDTIQACREACGGAGYMSENQLGQIRADVDVFATFEGDNTVLLQLTAKGILTQYQAMWGDLDIAEMAGMISKQLAEGLVERTTGRAGLQRLVDAAKGRDDESALDDRGWQLSMFEQRADHTLQTVARRLRGATGDDAFDRFNAAQDHVLLAARTHIDRLIMEAAAEAEDAVQPGAARDLLGDVLSLYALSSIEQDKGWFLEHGRLSTGRSRAVTAEVNALCARLRPHARTLVDAFGIPECLITAPIVRDAPAD